MDGDYGLKIDISNFEESFHLDDFVDQLHAIERVFEFKGYSNKKRCKVLCVFMVGKLKK